MHRGSGLHSRVVAILKVTLPLVAIALMLSIFIIPSDQATDGKLEFSNTDLGDLGSGPNISNPVFNGTTRGGDVFRFTASAVKPDAIPPTVAEIRNLDGIIEFTDGQTLSVSSEFGDLDVESRTMVLSGDVKLATSEGYRLNGAKVTVDLSDGVVRSSEAIVGEGPVGTLASGSMIVGPAPSDAQQKVFFFGGGVKLRYSPPRSDLSQTETP
jgi:lipopolysaccharide export system protein LptC